MIAKGDSIIQGGGEERSNPHEMNTCRHDLPIYYNTAAAYHCILFVSVHLNLYCPFYLSTTQKKSIAIKKKLCLVLFLKTFGATQAKCHF